MDIAKLVETLLSPTSAIRLERKQGKLWYEIEVSEPMNGSYAYVGR